ncbi:unnamed protein product [Pleuronectes platessa]|uniref:Protein kinase domain-containing protein n=1 Tax=Pleuronectes platessa TaxID=8262 RepID=A0A9N7V863_PLEPL|nr:unnamed protein product [Pleuronectes platessa]
MSQYGQFIILVGDLIPSPTTLYQVEKYLGSGAYGVVIQCKNVTTNETVALKIIKGRGNFECAKVELGIHQTMQELQSDRFNIVRLNESFTYKAHCCLVFEHLDMDLNKFMQINPGQQLQLMQIRPILQQLAASLVFLKSAGIIHTDLKPENIMIVDHVRQPLKVKVIDFGLAFDYPEQRRGLTLQTLWYRSPEILAGYPFSGAIDIWSLGCIAAQLFMGTPLFPAYNETDLCEIKYGCDEQLPGYKGFLGKLRDGGQMKEGAEGGVHSGPGWGEDRQKEAPVLSCQRGCTDERKTGVGWREEGTDIKVDSVYP